MAGPRPIWKGLLQISLVTIPIKVFPATESSESLAFHQLHADCQTRITQRRWCLTCGREVPSAEIVKGFEFETGKYVVVLPEELDAVQPPSTRVIDVVQFTDPTALEPRVFDRAYYLAPDGPEDGPTAHAYALLRAMMATRGRVGIGKLAIYGREYLVALDARPRCLMLYTLHHAAELRALEVGLPDVSTGTREERALIDQLITAFTRPLHLSDFTDAYQADLRRLIDAKIAGDEILIPLVPTLPVVKLKEALEQSLAAVRATTKAPAKARPAKRSA